MLMRLLPILLLLASAPPALAAEGGANPFAGRIFQAIAAAIVFLGLFYILKAKAWGPILKGLQDREKKIKEDLENAERSAREASQTLEKRQAELANAQKDAQEIINKGKADAEKLAAQMKDQVQSEVAEMRKKAQADIQAAKEQALSEIYSQAATLSTDIAGRILKREIKADEHEQLVQDSLAELRNVKNN